MINLSKESMSSKKIEKKLSIAKLFNLKNFNIILILVIISGGLNYLAGTNDLTVKGFELQALKKKSEIMKAENKDIEQRILALKSFESLNQRAEGLSMVSAGEIVYVAPGSGAVAMR